MRGHKLGFMMLGTTCFTKEQTLSGTIYCRYPILTTTTLKVCNLKLLILRSGKSHFIKYRVLIICPKKVIKLKDILLRLWLDKDRVTFSDILSRSKTNLT